MPTNEEAEPYLAEVEARQYLHEQQICAGPEDPRSAIELAQLHKSTGSTAIEGTTKPPERQRPEPLAY